MDATGKALCSCLPFFWRQTQPAGPNATSPETQLSPHKVSQSPDDAGHGCGRPGLGAAGGEGLVALPRSFSSRASPVEQLKCASTHVTLESADCSSPCSNAVPQSPPSQQATMVSNASTSTTYTERAITSAGIRPHVAHVSSLVRVECHASTTPPLPLTPGSVPAPDGLTRTFRRTNSAGAPMRKTSLLSRPQLSADRPVSGALLPVNLPNNVPSGSISTVTGMPGGPVESTASSFTMGVGPSATVELASAQLPVLHCLTSALTSDSRMLGAPGATSLTVVPDILSSILSEGCGGGGAGTPGGAAPSSFAQSAELVRSVVVGVPGGAPGVGPGGSVPSMLNLDTGHVSTTAVEALRHQLLCDQQLGIGGRPIEVENLEKVGQGSFGVVYRGVWQGAHVAIKYLLSSSDQQLAASATEALLSRLLAHPNVVQTFACKVVELTPDWFLDTDRPGAGRVYTTSDSGVLPPPQPACAPQSPQGDPPVCCQQHQPCQHQLLQQQQQQRQQQQRCRHDHQRVQWQHQHQQQHQRRQQHRLASCDLADPADPIRELADMSADERPASGECERGPPGDGGGGEGDGGGPTASQMRSAPCGCPSGANGANGGGVSGGGGGEQCRGSDGRLEQNRLRAELCVDPWRRQRPPPSGVKCNGGSGSGGRARCGEREATAHPVPLGACPPGGGNAAGGDAAGGRPPSGSGSGRRDGSRGGDGGDGGGGGEATGLLDTFHSGDGFGVPYLGVDGGGDGDGAGEGDCRASPHTLRQYKGLLGEIRARPHDVMTQLIMEYCDRGSLQRAIDKNLFRASPRWNARVALRALLRTAREVAQGMCHLHASQIVHGDLKPGNVLLKSSRSDRRGFVAKVADFGLSRLLHGAERSHLECDPDGTGTLAYMAPEVLNGSLCPAGRRQAGGARRGRTTDYTSHVYSFGVVLWQLVTGERPFADVHPGRMWVGVCSGALRLEWPPDAHPTLRKLGEACLSPDKRLRPSFTRIARGLGVIETIVRNEGAAAAAAAAAAARANSNSSCRDISGSGGGLRMVAAACVGPDIAAAAAAAAAVLGSGSTSPSPAQVLVPMPVPGVYGAGVGIPGVAATGGGSPPTAGPSGSGGGGGGVAATVPGMPAHALLAASQRRLLHGFYPQQPQHPMALTPQLQPPQQPLQTPQMLQMVHPYSQPGMTQQWPYPYGNLHSQVPPMVYGHPTAGTPQYASASAPFPVTPSPPPLPPPTSGGLSAGGGGEGGGSTHGRGSLAGDGSADAAAAAAAAVGLRLAACPSYGSLQGLLDSGSVHPGTPRSGAVAAATTAAAAATASAAVTAVNVQQHLLAPSGGSTGTFPVAGPPTGTHGPRGSGSFLGYGPVPAAPAGLAGRPHTASGSHPAVAGSGASGSGENYLSFQQFQQYQHHLLMTMIRQQHHHYQQEQQQQQQHLQQAGTPHGLVHTQPQQRSPALPSAPYAGAPEGHVPHRMASGSAGGGGAAVPGTSTPLPLPLPHLHPHPHPQLQAQAQAQPAAWQDPSMPLPLPPAPFHAQRTAEVLEFPPSRVRPALLPTPTLTPPACADVQQTPPLDPASPLGGANSPAAWPPGEVAAGPLGTAHSGPLSSSSQPYLSVTASSATAQEYALPQPRQAGATAGGAGGAGCEWIPPQPVLTVCSPDGRHPLPHAAHQASSVAVAASGGIGLPSPAAGCAAAAAAPPPQFSEGLPWPLPPLLPRGPLCGTSSAGSWDGGAGTAFASTGAFGPVSLRSADSGDHAAVDATATVASASSRRASSATGMEAAAAAVRAEAGGGSATFSAVSPELRVEELLPYAGGAAAAADAVRARAGMGPPLHHGDHNAAAATTSTPAPAAAPTFAAAAAAAAGHEAGQGQVRAAERARRSQGLLGQAIPEGEEEGA